MAEVGDLVAATSRWGGNDNVWLFRVTRTTAQRVYVEAVREPKGWGSPASGRGGNQYLNIDVAMPVRDMDHFDSIVTARKAFEQAMDDIEATANDKKRKARERYEAAIA